MRTSEVLNKAADLIEQRGWVGTNGRGWGIDDGTQLCLEGGIAAAMGTAVNSYGGFTSGPNLCPAGQAVRDYLGLGQFVSITASECLFQWNDEVRWDAEQGEVVPSRTASEVIEVLRACALIEAAREQQDAAWETYAEVVTA